MLNRQFYQDSLRDVLVHAGHVFVVDRRSTKGSVEALSELADSILSQWPIYSSMQFDGIEMVSDDLLAKLRQSVVSQGKAVLASDESVYREICDGFRRLDAAIIVIYNAEHLHKDILALLSRLLQYGARNEVRLQLVLVTNKDIRDRAFRHGLKIDHHYSLDKSSLDKTALSNIESNTEDAALFSSGKEFSSGAGSLKWILPVCFLCIFCAGAYGLFWADNRSPSELQSDAAHKDQQQAAPSIAMPDDIATPDGSRPQANTSYRQREAYMQEVERLQHKSLQFERTLAEIDKKYRTSQSEQKKPFPAKVPSSSNAAANIANKSGKPAKIRKANSKMSAQLLAAIRNNDIQKVKARFAAGESPDAVNESGESTLVMAAWLGHVELVKAVVESKAHIDARDNQGRSAMFYTAIEGDFFTLEYLLQQGANANLQSKLKKTALMAAVKNRHFEIAKLLLENKANPNLQDHSGWTALFYAVWNEDRRMVDLLMSHGANTGLRDKDNYTAVDIANLRGKTQIATLISR